jgi:hypothetical protein
MAHSSVQCYFLSTFAALKRIQEIVIGSNSSNGRTSVQSTEVLQMSALFCLTPSNEEASPKEELAVRTLV